MFWRVMVSECHQMGCPPSARVGAYPSLQLRLHIYLPTQGYSTALELLSDEMDGGRLGSGKSEGDRNSDGAPPPVLVRVVSLSLSHSPPPLGSLPSLDFPPLLLTDSSPFQYGSCLRTRISANYSVQPDASRLTRGCLGTCLCCDSSAALSTRLSLSPHHPSYLPRRLSWQAWKRSRKLRES